LKRKIDIFILELELTTLSRVPVTNPKQSSEIIDRVKARNPDVRW
jgi:hypothetical protein